MFFGNGAVGVDGVLAGDGGFWGASKGYFFLKNTKNGDNLKLALGLDPLL